MDLGLRGVISNILSLGAKLLPAVSASAQAPSSSSSPGVVQNHQIEAELKKLMRLLERIKATLYDAEQREIKDLSVKLWLKELKGVAYDAEDVLDEYHYEVLRAEVEARDASPQDSCKRKLIQAVIEDVSLKQQIFSDLEKYCNSSCVLATNTSTIDLDLIGQKTASQDRIAGAHFFSPAQVMPLLKIVRTRNTSPQVVVYLLDLAKKIRKTPIIVRNCTGFAVNRMFFPYTQAAFRLVDHGVDLYRIDRVMVAFGMPMGPFRLVDLVGFGVAAATGPRYLQSYPEGCYKSSLFPLMLQDETTGEASGKGFYIYDDKRKASIDPEIAKYIEKSRRLSGFAPNSMIAGLTNKDIVEMLFFPVVNEACRILDEGEAYCFGLIQWEQIMCIVN